MCKLVRSARKSRFGVCGKAKHPGICTGCIVKRSHGRLCFCLRGSGTEVAAQLKVTPEA